MIFSINFDVLKTAKRKIMSISIASVGFWYQNPYKNWGAFLTDGAPRGVFLFDPISAPPFFRRCPRKRGNYFFFGLKRNIFAVCLLFAPAPSGSDVSVKGNGIFLPFICARAWGRLRAAAFYCRRKNRSFFILTAMFLPRGGRTVFKIMKTCFRGLLQALCAGICRLRQNRFFAFWKKNICARRSYCCAIE